MIALNDFVTLWTGQTVSFPNCEDGQCMTLMHRYNSEVLGIEDPAVLSQPFAADVFTNFANVPGNQLFTLVANTPTNIPPPGAIVIWGKNSAVGIPVGHIAIVLEADVNSFTSFDANFPTGSLPHKQLHNYTDVLGWLIFSQPLPNVDQIGQQLKTQIEATSTCQTQLKAANDQVTTLQNQLTAQTNQANTKITALQNSVNDLQSKYDAEREETISLNGVLSKLTQTNKDYSSEAYIATKDKQTTEEYLYAIADSLHVKRSGVKDADIAEDILSTIDEYTSQLQDSSNKIQKLQSKLDTILTLPAQTQNAFLAILSYVQKIFWKST